MAFEIQMLRASHRGIPSLADQLRERFAEAAQELAGQLGRRLSAPVVAFEHALK